MMMMMIRKWHAFFFLLFLPAASHAQEKDFGIWYGISAEHKFSKKLELDLLTNVRTFNNAKKIDEAFLEGGITYNLSKRLEIAGSYRLSKNIEDNELYYFQHKLFFDLKGNVPLRNLNVSCRLRFEEKTKTYLKDENADHPYYTGRIKIKAVYKTPTFPLNPYIYIESFFPMFSENSGTIGKNRFSAGLDLNIVKHHSLELEYIFQRDYHPHLSDLNILSLNYDIKF
jgi:hypothetical protein